MPYTVDFDWFEPTQLIDIPKTNVYLAVDKPFMTRPPGVDCFIGIQLEPLEIFNTREGFIQNHKNFDILVAYDQEILNKCPNSKFYVYGTSWIPKSIHENINISRKKPIISSLTGWKNFATGHNFRLKLYEHQLHIPLPVHWFRSGRENLIPNINNNRIIGGDRKTGKSELFLDYQFSLIIENAKQQNWFTEKLIDCLITKTIPIYWGCPNIKEWFDTTGWVILDSDSVDEFIEKCKVLPIYENYTETINKNYETSKKFVSFTKNVGDAIGLSVKNFIQAEYSSH